VSLKKKPLTTISLPESTVSLIFLASGRAYAGFMPNPVGSNIMAVTRSSFLKSSKNFISIRYSYNLGVVG
jgi:hypothetical protein